MLIQSRSEPRSSWRWRDELDADDAEAFEGHLVLRRARVVRRWRVADQVCCELRGRCFRILGHSIPAESTVMKEWVRFLVIPSTCASERRGVLGLYLELWLRDPELLIADSSARLWLEASAASLRLMSSVCSLAKIALFFSSIEW